MKIRLIIIVTVLLVVSVFRTHAQELKYGLQTGLIVTIPHVKTQPVMEKIEDNYNAMLSYNLNGYLGFKSESFFGFSIEPGFIQKGGISNYDDDTEDDDIRIKLNYIQLPILADFYLADKILLSIGPEFSYLTNAGEHFYDEKYEISGILGTTYIINDKFDIGLRYNHGFTPILRIDLTDNEGNPSDNYVAEYNQYFQFLIRFKI